MEAKLKAKYFKFLVNLWPPLFFSGIKVIRISADYREIDVVLKLRWYSKNYVGVHYGGSLFSMTDPWYMVMLMTALGRDYYVWDKTVEIDYIKPGKTHVFAKFLLTQEKIDEIKSKTAGGEKYLPEFVIEIRDENNELIAKLKRILYVKLKSKPSP
jgi:acyl-coenzyme A thioesterase PaaI-like protein